MTLSDRCSRILEQLLCVSVLYLFSLLRSLQVIFTVFCVFTFSEQISNIAEDSNPSFYGYVHRAFQKSYYLVVRLMVHTRSMLCCECISRAGVSKLFLEGQIRSC